MLRTVVCAAAACCLMLCCALLLFWWAPYEVTTPQTLQLAFMPFPC